MGIITLKPEMYPAEEEILIQEGEVLEIKCKGEGELQFSTERNVAWVNQSEFNVSFNNDSGWYTFTRPIAIKEDTGWYACAEEGIEILNDEMIIHHPDTNISWIYVYVNSSKPFAIDTYDCDDHHAVLPVLWRPKSDLVLPCRPTSPGLPVIGEIDCRLLNGTLPVPENTRYDPKIGFTLNPRDSLSMLTQMFEHRCSLKCKINGTDQVTDRRPTSTLDVSDYGVLRVPQYLVIEDGVTAQKLVEENLTLTCIFVTPTFGEMASAYWKIPESVPVERRGYNKALAPYDSRLYQNLENRYWQTCRFQLTIYNVKISDRGNYTCALRDPSLEDPPRSAAIEVIVTKRGAVQAGESQYAKLGESSFMRCYVSGYPLTNYTWVKIGDSESQKDLKPRTSFDYGSGFDDVNTMFLDFYRVSRSDNGTYECRATDYSGTIVRNRTDLIVTEVPEVRTIFATSGGAESIYLHWTLHDGNRPVTEYSIERIKSGTTEWIECLRDTGGEMKMSSYITTGLERSTAYRFKMIANNPEGTSQPAYSEWVRTLDEDHEFVTTIWIKETIGPPVTIEWSTAPSEFEDHVQYYKLKITHGNSSEESTFVTSESNQYTVERLQSGIKYSIKISACSNYTDKCGDWSNELETIVIDKDPEFAPNISIGQTTSNSIQIHWSMPQTELLQRVHQYKLTATNQLNPERNKGPFHVDKTENSYVFEDLEPSTYYDMKVAACSEYRTRCWDWSSEGRVTLAADKGGNLLMWIVFSIIAILLFCMIVVWMIFLNRRERAARRRFIEASIEVFKLGARGSVDPELAMADQAELLPYNKKWEFPRKRLELGKVLGSGAFGIVSKATAEAICKGQRFSTVAVKMVRATHRLEHMMALQRELKILAHLGKHLNVVNLLGACTKKISYGQLLVIVEFCRFGNLHDYLLRRRSDFVDQVDVATGNIAGTSFRIDCAEPVDSGIRTGQSDSDPAMDDCSRSTGSDYITVGVGDPASVADANETVQVSNYEGDFTDADLKPIGTWDLLCWAWQVSRGMSYLSSKRVVHGDLAARNILLGDNNVVKICDFGLAKSLYANDIYKREGTGPLPIKWMAVESIRDRVFSVKSDVWSYGVVLWELFTLAETPYPGTSNEDVYQKLSDGFRMERPQYATEQIYRVMQRCWDSEPSKRPSFEEIKDIIDVLLDEKVKDHYVDFDVAYEQINAEASAKGAKDYLTMDPAEYASGSTEPNAK